EAGIHALAVELDPLVLDREIDCSAVALAQRADVGLALRLGRRIVEIQDVFDLALRAALEEVEAGDVGHLVANIVLCRADVWTLVVTAEEHDERTQGDRGSHKPSGAHPSAAASGVRTRPVRTR